MRNITTLDQADEFLAECETLGAKFELSGGKLHLTGKRALGARRFTEIITNHGIITEAVRRHQDRFNAIFSPEALRP